MVSSSCGAAHSSSSSLQRGLCHGLRNSSSLAASTSGGSEAARLPLVLRRADDEALSPHPPTSDTGPLTVRYPFAIDYYKDREAVVYSLDERPLGLAPLPGAAFNVPVRLDILHRVVRYWRAKWQQGTHKAKSRNEVSGGGKKPWAQKKTGRARQGSIRSPLWKGGGVPHGPRPRSHAHGLPRSTRLLGMRCALSAKINEGRFFVVDDLINLRAAPLQDADDAAAAAAAAPALPSGYLADLPRPGGSSASRSSSSSSGSNPARWSRHGLAPADRTIREYGELKQRLGALTACSYGSTWLLVDSGEGGRDGGLRLRKLLKCSVVMEVVSPEELTVYHVLKYHRLVVTRDALQRISEALTRPHRVTKPVKHAWWTRRRQAVEAAVQELTEAEAQA
ncbi:hypothetical protein HYH02_001825 [Chlamydomonas schloesseri]|uniref:Large ribosomal subunit protein uL4m n=1 Tax=Chlamydomonas schloesseri TaxID=2026947 RepID=A0A836BCA5_9CHLO|nr:hypothetical protein HYH02_001825 [Chlamydomonas schloesseri]|eukprot:KAG2453609.1 hypothetical protein HYH02_001825 [Chlamydomonas schloesseri]